MKCDKLPEDNDTDIVDGGVDCTEIVDDEAWRTLPIANGGLTYSMTVEDDELYILRCAFSLSYDYELLKCPYYLWRCSRVAYLPVTTMVMLSTYLMTAQHARVAYLPVTTMVMLSTYI